MKCGRLHQQIKPFRKCCKLQKTEVSHTNKSPTRSYILRHRYIKSPGHGISLKRDPNKIRDSWLPNLSKVRQPVKTNDLKADKNHKVLKGVALSGINMGKPNDKDMSENSDEERERQKNQHKNLNKKAQKLQIMAGETGGH